jgi:hypothetical protein
MLGAEINPRCHPIRSRASSRTEYVVRITVPAVGAYSLPFGPPSKVHSLKDSSRTPTKRRLSVLSCFKLLLFLYGYAKIILPFSGFVKGFLKISEFYAILKKESGYLAATVRLALTATSNFVLYFGKLGIEKSFIRW